MRSLLLQHRKPEGGTQGQMDLAGSAGKPLALRRPLLQPKLTIGRPNDRYEQEADRVADMVMRMPEPGIQLKPT